ncbi:YceI family protein [Dyella nitratireducens]|uniref:Polyisoprenoid-binding protein n=1 Tax=Dyella nitratireducens TaxID=1849580 RepID=A0ABQ1GPR2_9GAMM|nr:YceI family protein [Dyella nitratireducens]GGA47597.1 polyisoprenoid-binding protein [Dyella nitratireducens]GLQ42428.1 polyisoprenoid-binding protein [Dyella nitratireducens]
MRTLRYVLLAGLLGTALSAQAAPVTYKMDPSHTMVLFSWSHFGFSHPVADIGISDGTLVFDQQDPSKSTVDVTMPLSNLDTHVPALDKHLKEPDFFDADKYPTITFKSTSVQSVGNKHYKVTGDLTVHGVTKPVVLNATLNNVGPHPMTGQQAIGFNATATLKRSDFGLGAYVPKVSDEIQINITTEGSVPKTGQ